jgi:NADPH2:quinone reductase
MRAAVATRPGPPSVFELVDRPDPVPAAGEVVVDVEVAAITFIDTQLRSGRSPRSPGPFPIVLGNGVGGRITTIGDGVAPTWLGAEVVTSTGGSGGYASRARAAVDDLHHLPPGLDIQVAVALLADGRTAVGLAQAAQIAADETVVVTAAGGGVGSLLVQLALRAGARVVALAGDSVKLALARRLGAQVAINYRDADWSGQIDAAAPNGIDVVFDGVGGAVSAVLVDRARKGGRYVIHGASSGTWAGIDADDAASRGVTVVPLAAIGATPGASFDLVEQALALALEGAIHPTIGQWFPLERVSDAHAAIERRATLGKTLLIV